MSTPVKCPRCGHVETFIKGYLPDTCVCRMCLSQLDWREIPGMGPECTPLEPSEAAALEATPEATREAGPEATLEAVAPEGAAAEGTAVDVAADGEYEGDTRV